MNRTRRLHALHAGRPRLACTLATVAVAVLSACAEPKSAAPQEPPDPPESSDSIPIASLAGKLLGENFAVQSARYTVDRRMGYEKIDIKLLSGKPSTPCGSFESGEPASVWIRRTGDTTVEPTEQRITVKTPGQWAVHYQLKRDGQWMGNGDAKALVVISDVQPDMKLTGALWACFRDSSGSCVKGQFSAEFCQIHIDAPVRGTKAMERPTAREIAKHRNSAPESQQDRAQKALERFHRGEAP